MKAVWPTRKWSRLALAALMGASATALGQQRARTIEEPQWLKFRLREISAGGYAEGVFEETSYKNSGTSVTHDRFFVGPTLGLNAEGSIYHPNLLRYQLLVDGAVGWAEDTVDSPTTSRTRDELQYLGRFHGSADILPFKPYNANVFGTYDHTFRDYDFFSRSIVDTWRYGGKLNYNTESLFLSAGYTHREEDASGLNVNTRTEDDVVNVLARNERHSGSTSFSYDFIQYTRSDFGRVGEGRDHTIALSDSERFGSHDQFRFNGNASYTHRDDVFETSDQVTSGATLLAEHRHNLSSFYDLNYDHFSTGGFSSDSAIGRAELRHQLYASLASTLIVEGADFEASDPLSSGYTRRFGGGFTEGYTKSIGSSHRLRVDNSFLLEHVDQQSIGTVENERHTFATTLGGAPLNSFLLNQPNVIQSSIVVTDENDTQPAFLAGIDYDVIQNGNLTLIRRREGSRVPDTVLVDYRTEPTPAGSYEALSESFQARLELWENLWGIYGRLNLFLNNAPDAMRVPTIRSYTFGTDVTWRWLRAGVEYEIYDSDLSRYRSTRLFQSLTFRPDLASTLSFHLSETWTDYLDAHRSEENYRFITRYHRMMTSHLGLDVEGGVALRRGELVDQTLATFRPSIDYWIGKTSIKVGYDYEYELFLDNEERNRHLFFLQVRRVF